LYWNFSEAYSTGNMPYLYILTRAEIASKRLSGVRTFAEHFLIFVFCRPESSTLFSAGIIERVSIATRSGQVVLYQLTDIGRNVCSSHNIDSGHKPRESLEHKFWVHKIAKHFKKKSYEVKCEHPVRGNGAIDILAKSPGEKIAVEVETGKSDIKENLNKITSAGFDRIVLFATSPVAVAACQKAVDSSKKGQSQSVELLNWLDIS
jgi:hypothetical protein